MIEKKIIPYGRQHIDENDINSVIETLKSDFLTQGPKVEKFESEFAKYVGAKYAVAVSNATAGLHLSVLSLELKKGERVITTPITFAASANCIRYNGGEVWFADIDPDTYLISFQKTKELIESKPRGFFKGIIVVDFAGLPVNLEKFKNLADKHGLWVIEDACHAPGGHFIDSKNKISKCGSARYSSCSIFSFHPVKHIACGEGGMITTNSKALHERLILLRSHGITKNPSKLSENQGNWYYEMIELGFNYRLTDIQASLGSSQLKKNKSGLKRRNEIAKIYKNSLNGKVKYQMTTENFFNAYHLFVIKVENRKKLYDYLYENGVSCQIHYIPIHKFPYYKKIGYENADLKNSTDYYKTCLSLPMFPSLKDEEQIQIIKLINDFIKKHERNSSRNK